MSNIVCLALVGMCLLGCSTKRASTAVRVGSGDLASFIVGEATRLGGHPVTNKVPELEAHWTVQQIMPGAELILASGVSFDQVEAFLRHVYGQLDGRRGSIPVAQSGHGRQDGTIFYADPYYSQAQIGVGLGFNDYGTNRVAICISDK